MLQPQHLAANPLRHRGFGSKAICLPTHRLRFTPSRFLLEWHQAATTMTSPRATTVWSKRDAGVKDVEGPKGHNGGHTVPTAAPGHAAGSAEVRGMPSAASVEAPAPPTLPPRSPDFQRHQRNTGVQQHIAGVKRAASCCIQLARRCRDRAGECVIELVAGDDDRAVVLGRPLRDVGRRLEYRTPTVEIRQLQVEHRLVVEQPAAAGDAGVDQHGTRRYRQ